MNLFPHRRILGINARNLLYIRPYNKRKAIQLADDKLKTKQFLSARNIPVPKLYSTINSHKDLLKFDFSSLPPSFVVKPNCGSGGAGIIPIIAKTEEGFQKPNGEILSPTKFQEHISDILEGRFSKSGEPDTAFFEQRIICDEKLAKFAYKGLPDIRVVVHNLIPVMAMLRLPTKESDGRANLHQGAVGVGIDIASGTVTHIVYKGKIVQEIPEVGDIRGLTIPYWEDILLVSSQIQLLTNLGYLAADIALDRNLGPILLEINARAGLSVQIANLAPLRRRLDRIVGIKVKTPEKGVRIAQELFGNKLNKEIKQNTGKTVVGTYEKVTLLIKQGETRLHWALLRPNEENTWIDRKLAEELQFFKKEGSDIYKLKLNLAGERIQTLARVDDFSDKPYELVLGQKDLRNFLIDPSKAIPKNFKLSSIHSLHEKKIDFNPYSIDHQLSDLDSNLNLLHYIQPQNIEEEKENFFNDVSYQPHFSYPELELNLPQFEETLKELREQCDDSMVGQLFQGKIKELQAKVNLLKYIGSEEFTEKSIELYGYPNETEQQLAKEWRGNGEEPLSREEPLMSPEEVLDYLNTFLEQHGLHNWEIVSKKDMVSVASITKDGVIFLRENFQSTKTRLKRLIAHEIETHLFTAENGRDQPFQLFQRGFGFYLMTQEGLALWNQENLDLSKKSFLREWPALLLLLGHYARDHTFRETYLYAREEFGLSENKAFTTVLKAKRGLKDGWQKGCFTKSSVYLRGLLQIENFINLKGDLKDLYYGKYALEDLPLIKKVPNVVSPRFLPDLYQQQDA